jgi:5-methylcytosine-specific restriction protein A
MSVIESAQRFVIDQVLEPALKHDDASVKLKSVIKNTLLWVRHFRKVGDLNLYLQRFHGNNTNTAKTYRELTALRLNTFEEIKDRFSVEFRDYIDDITTLNSFIVGDSYTSYDINIFARLYDNRTGGIIKIGDLGQHEAVFVKATLTGGKYPNQWLHNPERLKYYLKSDKDNFNEKSPTNQSIIGYPHVPIYAFVRDHGGEPFVLKGIYQNIRIHEEDDGSRWFELHRTTTRELRHIESIQQVQEKLNEAISRSAQLSHAERLRRLKSAPTIPNKKAIVSEIFLRNPDVVAEVLYRAKEECEGCKRPAPFTRKRNNTGYLEVHHKIPLSKGGPDTVDNAAALCPNCHRQEHFGSSPVWPGSDDELQDYLE